MKRVTSNSNAIRHPSDSIYQEYRLMSHSGVRPVPAVRKTTLPDSGASTGLLINVIRTLTSSVSEDQRELEKTRLEKGFKESGTLIDRLVREHHKDVEICLDSFRDVSTRISTCRERIHNVRNALQTCKTLLECRRDDLKKLWVENAQQKYICEIMAQLEELRETPTRVEQHMASGNYQEAAKLLSNSKNIMDSRMASIEGLSQLGVTLSSYSEKLAHKISEQISEMLVVEPFESNMIDVVRSMPEQRVNESEQCTKLAQKGKDSSSLTGSLSSRLAVAVGVLTELEGGTLRVQPLISLSTSQIEKQIAASITLIRTRAAIDDNGGGDVTHLTQLIQMVVSQIESSRAAHTVLAEIAATSPGGTRVMSSFWDAVQSVVETLVSDHLDMGPLSSSKEPLETKQLLFRFDGTAFAGSATTGSTTQNPVVVCTPSPFNMVHMFPWLRKLTDYIEKSTGDEPCKLRRFVHSFVMELFVERVKSSLADKMEAALKGAEPSSGKNQSNPNVLRSCERVLELCNEVHDLVVSMDLYADRFAALWLLILTEYNKHISEMYERTTLSLGEQEGMPVRRKISAAWAADEDISRLLMSLPNWQIAASSAQTVIATPTTPAAEGEKEIRERNERESEILIGNLGTQKKIDRVELVSDMSDVRALAALHESLRWFAVEMRKLISSLPLAVKNLLDGCLVQVRFKDGQVTENEPVLKAIEECVRKLESISDTGLLMLHLELRVHCFFHLLPIARARNILAHDDIDPEVNELGRDLLAFHELLKNILSQPKLRYIFDGLGHLCAAIFIHSSQHMPKLTEAGKRRLVRDVRSVQQRLSQLTTRREAALDRAKDFFELLSHDPDRLVTILSDKRTQLSAMEMGHLVALSVRSHPVLAGQPGALDQRLAQLSAILERPVTK